MRLKIHNLTIIFGFVFEQKAITLLFVLCCRMAPHHLYWHLRPMKFHSTLIWNTQLKAYYKVFNVRVYCAMILALIYLLRASVSVCVFVSFNLSLGVCRMLCICYALCHLFLDCLLFTAACHLLIQTNARSSSKQQAGSSYITRADAQLFAQRISVIVCCAALAIRPSPLFAFSSAIWFVCSRQQLLCRRWYFLVLCLFAHLYTTLAQRQCCRFRKWCTAPYQNWYLCVISNFKIVDWCLWNTERMKQWFVTLIHKVDFCS